MKDLISFNDLQNNAKQERVKFLSIVLLARSELTFDNLLIESDFG